MRGEHAGALARLRDLAERNLSLAGGDVELVYGLQALMAFEDSGVWQRQLSHVADGELAAIISCAKRVEPQMHTISGRSGTVSPLHARQRHERAPKTTEEC